MTMMPYDKLECTRLPEAFSGKSGRFYVLRPDGQTNPAYAVRSSVEAYNSRSELPIYVNAAEALTDFSTVVKIYPQNLKTTPPTADIWEREEPADSYRPRQLWNDIFTKARARYVA